MGFDLYLVLYATIIPVYIDCSTDVDHGGINKMLIYLNNISGFKCMLYYPWLVEFASGICKEIWLSTLVIQSLKIGPVIQVVLLCF